jgi:hypothetical protein
VLAVIYLALSAKPVSLRRLLILFAFALASANLVLVVFHPKHAPNVAFVIAAAVSLLAWSMPLARLAYCAVRFRVLVSDVLLPVSDVIRWTYGFALAAAPMLGVVILVAPTHRLGSIALLRIITVASVAGLALQRGWARAR